MAEVRVCLVDEQQVCRPKGAEPIIRPVLIVLWIVSMLVLLVLLALSPLTFTRADPYSRLDEIFDRYQIPHHNVPYLYEISLRVYLPFHPALSFDKRNFTMDGQSTVHFECRTPNRRILLHSLWLEYQNVRVVDDLGNQVPVTNFTVDRQRHLLDIETYDLLTVGVRYKLYTNYTGRLPRRASGIFTAGYQHQGQHRFMVATHLQTMEARTVFPCLDVPEMKAKFVAHVWHPYGTEAVSNTKEVEVLHEGDWTSTRFEQTPTMSTYLFALCISDFPYSEVYTKNNVRIRVYTEPSMINDTQVALGVVPKLLDFYEEYFQIPYPLSKLDIFSVPSLRVAAMENWGLIICKQKFVVYNAQIYKVSERRQVTDLLSHEVAHQWFGNLVTMKWWNNLWLNEGFATMIGMKAADYLENVTIRTEETAVEYNARAYRYDQQVAQSIAVSIRDGILFPPDLQFNQIVYRKASGLLRMVEAIVGPDLYREGLRAFLNKFAYQNADHNDLLQTLQQVHDTYDTETHISDQNFTLTDVMETWIYRRGFPLLTVVRDATVNTRNGWRVSQSFFKMSLKATEFDSSQWKIPIFIRNGNTSTSTRVEWLIENKTVHVDTSEDLVLDRNGRFYGRIFYDIEGYDKISERLLENKDSVPISSRTRLMDDSFTAAEIGTLSYGIVLKMALYLRNEVAYTPLLITVAHIDVLINRFILHAEYGKLQAYIRELFEPLFEKFVREPLDTNNMSLYQDSLREQVYMRLCLAGYQPCIKYTRKLFDQIKERCRDYALSNGTCNIVPTHLRMPVYGMSMLYGNDSDFEFLYRKWKEEIYDIERDRIWSGMAASKDKGHIHRLFREAFLGPQMVDFKSKCFEYTKYCHHINHFKSFTVEHLDEILNKYKGYDHPLEQIFLCFTRSNYDLEEIEQFLRIEGRFNETMKSHIVSKKMGHLGRLTQMAQWRHDYGDYVFGNLTQILRERNKLEDIVNYY